MSDIRKRKREMAAMKKAADKLERERQREAKRKRNRETRRCFWTWPFGHVWDGRYEHQGFIRYTHCAVCGKEA